VLAYRELKVWQRSFRLALDVADAIPETVPPRYWRIADQCVAAAFSVPANIAEGNGRSTPLDYASFLDRARASLFELDTWVLALMELRLVSPANQSRMEAEMEEISAMLFAMTRSLRGKRTLESR
jgi:four helix bundle protein